MENIAIPGLKDCERAFRVDTGEIVVVRITRSTTLDARFIAFKIDAWLATEDGDVVEIDGVPAIAPAEVRTILTDAIASGALTIEGEMADATIRAVEKALRHATAMRAWSRIPVEPAAYGGGNGSGSAA